MPTTQAHRVLKARRIIAAAYGTSTNDVGERILRVELLGDSIAVARVQTGDSQIPSLLVAQLQSSGRAVRLLRENRSDFSSARDMFRYLEELYGRHGGTSGEPAQPAIALSKGSLRLIR